MGIAILHLHSSYSDGMSTVEEILDEVENNSDVDIIGITDHDDCRSFPAAMEWKERHPGSRVQPIWGTEITLFGFTHILAYKMHPPFPTSVPRKFQRIRKVVKELTELGCYVVVPHVDAPMVGMGRRTLGRISARMPIFGYELLTPYFTAPKSLPALRALGQRHGLVPLGGPDAHFLEDLYRIVLRFPGHSVEEFERSWKEGTVAPEAGREGQKKTLRRRLQQQHRSMIEHPRDQVRAWVRGQLNGQG